MYMYFFIFFSLDTEGLWVFFCSHIHTYSTSTHPLIRVLFIYTHYVRFLHIKCLKLYESLS